MIINVLNTRHLSIPQTSCFYLKLDVTLGVFNSVNSKKRDFRVPCIISFLAVIFLKSSSQQSKTKNLINFFNDREYYRRIVNIGIPITLQQLVTSSLNLVGQVMIGQLGEVALASVSLANQIFFLLTMLLFGLNTGLAILTAQFWGAGDVKNIRRILGLAVFGGLSASSLVLLACQFFPASLIGVYTEDPAVIALGSQYLRLFSWTFIFFSVEFSYSIILRTVGQVRIPMVVSIFALSLNTILSYIFIFGFAGVPAMGVIGAAYAIITARVVECLALLYLAYRLKTPVAAKISEMLDLPLTFVRRVLPPVWPVALNEMLWSFGISTYSVIYARISTQSIAAVNIAQAIDNMAFVLFSGMAHATAVLVGNWIGAGDEEQAYRYSGRSIVIGSMIALVIGGMVWLFSPFILSLYKVSPEVILLARRLLIIVALFLWMRAANVVMIIGVFRSGGDTRFGLFLDGIIIWILGVPMAYIGAFIFHLPVYFVYLLVMSEETTKFILGLRRYFSKLWIHNLADSIHET